MTEEWTLLFQDNEAAEHSNIISSLDDVLNPGGQQSADSLGSVFEGENSEVDTLGLPPDTFCTMIAKVPGIELSPTNELYG